MSPAAKRSVRVLVHAATVVDGAHVDASPGAALLEFDDSPPAGDAMSCRVIAAGSPESIGAVADATRVRLAGHTIVPSLVNAHSHLDLTHIGPRPFAAAGGSASASAGTAAATSDGTFAGWAAFVRSNRATTDRAIAASVDRGIELSRAGGVAAVGDIAGMRSPVPLARQRAAGLRGVSFIEIFGVGRRQAAAIDAMREIAAGWNNAAPSDVDGSTALPPIAVCGLQPHAPYSCGTEVFVAAGELGERTGVPLATHLAETLEELEFAEHGTGPLAGLLREVGAWDESIRPWGAHPVEALAGALARGRWLAAHLNYVGATHIAILARLRVSVAYCPRASEYFGHPRAGREPHAYRAMVDAGVNVALGTDSILCLETPDRISTLDEMRLLHRRDGADPRLLLRMATINGATALGLDPRLFTLEPGVKAGIVAIAAPTLTEALRTRAGPTWLIRDRFGAMPSPAAAPQSRPAPFASDDLRLPPRRFL